MTTLIIKSNSEEKTHLLLQFAEELGLSATTQNFRELTAEDLVKDKSEPVSLQTAFAKYLDQK